MFNSALIVFNSLRSNKKATLLIGFNLTIILFIIVVLIWRGINNSGKSNNITDTPTAIPRSIKSVKIDGGLSDLQLLPEQDEVYVLDSASSQIHVLKANNLEAKTDIDLVYPDQSKINPERMFVHLPTSSVYISTQSGKVLKVSLKNLQVIGEVVTGGVPTNMLIDPLNHYLIVLDELRSKTIFIDLAEFKLVKEIPVGTKPVSVAVDRLGEFVYVGSEHDGTVTIISISGLIAVDSVSAGGKISKVMVVPGEDWVFVLLKDPAQLKILNQLNNTFILTIPTVDTPSDISYDGSRYMYIPSFRQNLIGIVDLQDKKLKEIIRLGSAFIAEEGLNKVIIDEKRSNLILININSGQVYQVGVN